jgi:MFS family permease
MLGNLFDVHGSMHKLWWLVRLSLPVSQVATLLLFRSNDNASLGGFEALLIPAVTLLVSMWYRPEEQPRRNSIILNVIAPIINGFVAWLISYNKSSFPGWKIIFLAIGAFTILWAGVTFLFL